MTDVLHIVEPTLMTEAGHCYSFVDSLCQASHGLRLKLWVSRRANIAFSGADIQVEKHFYRRIRKLQCLFLYRKLLASPGKLFIATAGVMDMTLLNWASRGAIQKDKVYLYFHWLNMNARKMATLKNVAKRNPNIVILGPTPLVINEFKEAGFANAHIVPYPISASTREAEFEPADFSGLLYAGAARQDKGFSHVVDLVGHMNELALKIPVKLQNSPDHHGRYDAATREDLQRLGKINYPYLQVFPDTLSTREYANLFKGAVSLQLYDPILFKDRISGVTLDSLSAGCPITTTAGSWIARMVQRFDAGVVVDGTDPKQILSAVMTIIDDYRRYNSAEILLKKLMA